MVTKKSWQRRKQDVNTTSLPQERKRSDTLTQKNTTLPIIDASISLWTGNRPPKKTGEMKCNSWVDEGKIYCLTNRSSLSVTFSGDRFSLLPWEFSWSFADGHTARHRFTGGERRSLYYTCTALFGLSLHANVFAKGKCHVIAHGDDRNKINTILPLEWTVATRQKSDR